MTQVRQALLATLCCATACLPQPDDGDRNRLSQTPMPSSGSEEPSEGTTTPLPPPDRDGDGEVLGVDCDDDDPALHHHDLDGDGVSSCDGDCDDGSAGAVPGGTRVCGDGIDNDCDGFGDCEWLGDVDLDAPGVSTARFRPPGHVGGGWLDLGDIDGDGELDLLYGDVGDTWFHRGPLTGDHDMSDADAVVHGGKRGATLGDLNGDGRDDAVIISADLWGAWVDVYSGPVLDGVVSPWQAMASIDWLQCGSCFYPTSVLDVNADGFGDLVLGDRWGSWWYGNGGSHGEVHIYPGPLAGDVVRDDVLTVIADRTPGGDLGDRLWAESDLTGDAVEDLLLFSSASDTSVCNGDLRFSHVHLLSSPLPSGHVSSEDLPVFTDCEETIDSAVGAGDIDGDGYGDAVFQMWGSYQPGPGRDFRIVPGPLDPGGGDTARMASATIYMEGYGPATVAPVGDVNGDGWDDLMIGRVVHLEDDSPSGSSAYLIYGPVLGSFDLVDSEDTVRLFADDLMNTGSSIASAGDWDGDGGAELALLGKVESYRPFLFLLATPPGGW